MGHGFRGVSRKVSSCAAHAQMGGLVIIPASSQDLPAPYATTSTISTIHVISTTNVQVVIRVRIYRRWACAGGTALVVVALGYSDLDRGGDDYREAGVKIGATIIHSRSIPMPELH